MLSPYKLPESFARDFDAEVFQLGLPKRLRGEYVLDFGGADAVGECAECAVRGGVRVAAHDGFAGQG